MKVLSIFVDESGDFGEYNTKFAPHYTFSMVFAVNGRGNDVFTNIRDALLG